MGRYKTGERCMKKYFKDWSLYEKLWLFLFAGVNIYLFFAFKDTIIGLIASLTGMLCVILTAKGKISNYYFGIINVLLYGFIAFQNKYYGEALLNIAYFFPMSIVGIYFWVKHKNKDKIGIVNVRKIRKKEFLFWILISIAGTVGYGLFLKNLGGTLPFLDASSTVLSITGMILTVRRATSQWSLWIVEDILEVGMWVYIFLTTKENISMVIMWTAYLINAVYGYYNWKNLEKIQNGN
jgi:nicotinamide mononucleotide transporter